MKEIPKLIFSIIFIGLISQTKTSLLFQLLPNQPRCYIDELFNNSAMSIKWKIFTKTKADISFLLPKIQIYVTSEETKQQIFSEIPNLPKSKTSFKVKKEGQYRICALLKTREMGIREALYMYMKFGSDNMDEININDSLKSADISSIDSKTKQIIELSHPIIERQKSDLELENQNAEATINITKWYKFLTFGQIGIVIIIGIIQLNNYRKFLKSQNII